MMKADKTFNIMDQEFCIGVLQGRISIDEIINIRIKAIDWPAKSFVRRWNIFECFIYSSVPFFTNLIVNTCFLSPPSQDSVLLCNFLNLHLPHSSIFFTNLFFNIFTSINICLVLSPSPYPRHCIVLQLLKFASASQLTSQFGSPPTQTDISPVPNWICPFSFFFYCSYWQRGINGWKERNTLLVTCPKNPMLLKFNKF